MISKENVGIPLHIILKIIKFLELHYDKIHNLKWIQNKLIGISSGERNYHKIKFPINFKTQEGTKILTSLIGDGGLGFRSNLRAWAVPHYAQFRHKELLNHYVKAVKKTFGINIKKGEKIELPAVCGYIIVASGYFVPGHKSFTNPSFPLKKYKESLFSTSLNWLISDDGCFSQNNFSISSGAYYLNKKPLNYLKTINEIIRKKFNNINTRFILDKKWLTYNLELTGKLSAMAELDNLFKKYSKGVFAIKKEKALRYYLYTHKYSLNEYLNRYDKNGNKNKLHRYWG